MGDIDYNNVILGSCGKLTEPANADPEEKEKGADENKKGARVEEAGISPPAATEEPAETMKLYKISLVISSPLFS